VAGGWCVLSWPWRGSQSRGCGLGRSAERKVGRSIAAPDWLLDNIRCGFYTTTVTVAASGATLSTTA
jgi:hypothetical protein